MSKPVLISGIQPSGKLHIGNYLGALKNFVDLQNLGRYECLFPIVDLHSLTKSYDQKEKPAQILDVAADYLAAGLDPKKSTIFLQSAVPAHTELMWILSAIAPFSELRRMTQFKDKSEAAPENVNVGLFFYPILMAADIFLYDTKYVPVGDDQLQHLELTRTLSRRFNERFGKTFVEPKALMTETPRVMSLDDPAKKMSKSRPKGCLYLDDSPDEIRRKIKSAVTDSGSEIKYDEVRKPAISNLLKIYSSFSREPIAKLEKQFAGKTYSEFKVNLANCIADSLANFRKKKTALTRKPNTIKTILARGGKSASLRANRKIGEVKQKIGLTL